MSVTKDPVISVVVPLYNEATGLPAFHASLLLVVKKLSEPYEIVYCDDGSTDSTTSQVRLWHADNPHVRLVRLSRNFGKENALTAGIEAARGEAIITLDGDGQHPVELIPEFIAAWRAGAQVVIGIRTGNHGEGLFKRLGSRLFYQTFNKLTGQKLLPGSSDFRLIDKQVQKAFLRLHESDRITRGLIDWIGFRRSFLPFSAKARNNDTAGYSRRKLVRLAADSFVSLTPTPLYIFGYLGVLITMSAFVLGSAVVIEQLLLHDPWHWRFTGTAMLSILLLFLIGIVLMSQGILSLYISHTHNQSKQRPLYIIDYKASAGVEDHKHG